MRPMTASPLRAFAVFSNEPVRYRIEEICSREAVWNIPVDVLKRLHGAVFVGQRLRLKSLVQSTQPQFKLIVLQRLSPIDASCGILLELSPE
jgi:hypothetical protein